MKKIILLMFSWNLIFYGNPLIAEEFNKGFFEGNITAHCLYYLMDLLPEDTVRQEIEFTYKYFLDEGASNEFKNYVKNYRFQSAKLEKCNSLLP